MGFEIELLFSDNLQNLREISNPTMRSTLSLRRQLVRNANTKRSFTTALPRISQLSAPICQACSRRTASTNTPPRSQRRWQTTSPSPAFNADDSIKSNPIPQTHYEFFPKTLPSGPPPSGPFHIDVRELRREFLQLQSIAHPDRHPQHLKTRAEATSARINEAYKTLQNPLLRAQYLLSLRGIDVAEDETAKVDDPELLMEVLDAREEIENAEEEGVRLRYWVNIRESLDAWERGKPVVLVH